MVRTVWVVTCDEYPKQAYWKEKNAEYEVEAGDEVCSAYHDATEVVIYDEEYDLNENQSIVLKWLRDGVENRSKDPIQLLYLLHKNVSMEGFYSKSPYREYFKLSQKEECELLAVFAERVLSEMEDNDE